MAASERPARQRAERRKQDLRRVQLEVSALHADVHEADLDADAFADLVDADRHPVVVSRLLANLDGLFQRLPGEARSGQYHFPPPWPRIVARMVRSRSRSAGFSF